MFCFVCLFSGGDKAEFQVEPLAHNRETMHLCMALAAVPPTICKSFIPLSYHCYILPSSDSSRLVIVAKKETRVMTIKMDRSSCWTVKCCSYPGLQGPDKIDDSTCHAHTYTSYLVISSLTC